MTIQKLANMIEHHIKPSPLKIGFPLISVVVVFNKDHESLEETLQSILSQTYPNIECILVDQTGEKQVESPVLYCDGSSLDFYSALNKGVRQAHGQWLMVLKPGESLQDERIFELIFARPINADVIYGDCEISTPSYTYIRKAKPTSLLWQGMAFQVSSAFFRTSLLQSHPFKTNLLFTSEFEFIYALYTQHAHFACVPHCLSRVKLKQEQTVNSVAHLKEYQKIVLEHDPLITINMYFTLKMAWASVKPYVKPLIPSWAVPFLLQVRKLISRFI